jgi:ribosomal protein S20
MAKGKTKRHASALKAKRQALAHQAANVQVRSKVRTLTNKVLKDIAAKNLDAAKASFKAAQSVWKKAAHRHVFPKQAAARKIARMSAAISALSAKS